MARFPFRLTHLSVLACCLVVGARAVTAQDPTPALTDPPQTLTDTDNYIADEEAIESTPYYDGATDGVYAYPRQDLFYNYYAQPGVPAGMYPTPYPTPPVVGHTFYTYQPFYPHEFLYPHTRVYVNYHGDGSYNKTTVRWQRGYMRPSPAPAKILPLQHGGHHAGNCPNCH